MRTPTKYTKLINEGKISDEILGACIYSCNKRAKNWRDTVNYYKSCPGLYQYVQNARDERDSYYAMKDAFLSKLSPDCVHRELGEEWYHGELYGSIYRYYYFYKIGGYSFHQPVEEKQLDRKLPVIPIDSLYTEGEEIEDLLSVQFCSKVLSLLKSGNYERVSDN